MKANELPSSTTNDGWTTMKQQQQQEKKMGKFMEEIDYRLLHVRRSGRTIWMTISITNLPCRGRRISGCMSLPRLSNLSIALHYSYIRCSWSRVIILWPDQLQLTPATKRMICKRVNREQISMGITLRCG